MRYWVIECEPPGGDAQGAYKGRLFTTEDNDDPNENGFPYVKELSENEYNKLLNPTYMVVEYSNGYIIKVIGTDLTYEDANLLADMLHYSSYFYDDFRILKEEYE